MYESSGYVNVPLFDTKSPEFKLAAKEDILAYEENTNWLLKRMGQPYSLDKVNKLKEEVRLLKKKIGSKSKE